ncbi:MAG: ATP-binding cassette domain-containing protein [Bacteroidota bacterium]
MGLIIDSVRKRYGERQVINDVFLSCTVGQIIGLFGRNGCGKSSLLKIIFGSIGADYKYVVADGNPANTLFNNKNTIKYLPQDHFLPDHIKIKNIISCFCSASKAINVTENEFLKPHLNKKVRELSGGERRVLEILLVVNTDAIYILLDEPFNGIAPIYIQTIKEIILACSASKGIIITDHDYENVLDIATHLTLMTDGNIRQIADREELRNYGYLPCTLVCILALNQMIKPNQK